MDGLFRALTVVVAFTAIMTVASMLVATVVRYLHYLRRDRGQNLAEMLAAFNYGFRVRARDAVAPGDAPSVTFATDVLRDPALHGVEPPKLPRNPGRASPGQLKDAVAEQLLRVDYVPIELIIRVVRLHSRAGMLPNAWHTRLPPQKARASALIAYIKKEQEIVQGGTQDRFRTQTKQLVQALSLLLVVLLHFDTIDVVTRMVRGGASASVNAIAGAAPDFLQLARATGLDQPLEQPTSDQQFLVELPWTELLAVFNERELGFGWQNSWYVRERCSYDLGCAEKLNILPRATPPLFERLISLMRWLGGLGLSWLLLLLGAPFWSDRLRDALNLRNAVRQRMERVPTP